MNKKYLLDASAVLALLQDEPGASHVMQRLSLCAISTVNLAEIASVLNKIGMPENEVHGLFGELDLEIIVHEKNTAIATGGIRRVTQQKGLSLGDRACLATAKQYQLIALTVDKAWLGFQENVGVEIECIR